MAQTEFTIRENLLPILSRLAGDNPCPISPWAQIEPVGEMNSKAWNLLEEAGLCASGQQLKEEVRDTIALLREPSRFMRLRLMNGPTIIEHVIYSCDPGQTKVSLSSSAEGLIAGNPAPLEQIMVGLLEHWGDSALASSSLKLTLGRETALVFAALVDLHRREALGAWASMQDFQAREYSLEEIRSSLDKSPRDGQWLVTAVSAFAGWEKELLDEEIRKALAFLLEQKAAEKGIKGFKLADHGLAFANNFLLISQALRLEVGAQQQGSEVVHSGMLCLQAGIHDHLYLEMDKDKLTVEAVSAHYIAEMVDAFLTGAFILQRGEELNEPASGTVIESDLSEKSPEGISVQEKEAEKKRVFPSPGEEIASGKSAGDSGRSYYMNRDGNNYGPYTWEELRGFASGGQLQLEDLVWNASRKKWVRADALQGLF